MEGRLKLSNIVECRGKMAYNESAQAWNLIRLKNEVLHQFSQLKDKRSKFTYDLIFCKDKNKFKELANKIIKDEDTMPLMIFLNKDESQ